jgi:hypothetical protein
MPQKRRRAPARQRSPKTVNYLPGLAFFLVIDFLVVATIYLALANMAQREMNQAQTTSIVIPQTTISSSGFVLGPQVLNITLRITNDEIVGRYGYWALANYTRTVKGYQILNSSSNASSNVYFLIVGLNGTWRTFAGALSPSNGTVEPLNGSGPLHIKYSAIEGYPLNMSAQLTGYIGKFDLNGTASDVLKGRYANQTGISPSAFHWTERYFNFSGNVNATRNYTCVFTFGDQTYSIIINQTGDYTTGDIVT